MSFAVVSRPAPYAARGGEVNLTPSCAKVRSEVFAVPDPGSAYECEEGDVSTLMSLIVGAVGR